jgi:Domain of unknown function (DUF4258)
MIPPDSPDLHAVLRHIRELASEDMFRVTRHAQEEMAEEGILLDEVLEAIASAQVVENYPGHRRGPCCLVAGYTASGRPLHVVCTTERPLLILITVYEPTPPRWVTPTERGPRR